MYIEIELGAQLTNEQQSAISEIEVASGYDVFVDRINYGHDFDGIELDSKEDEELYEKLTREFGEKQEHHFVLKFGDIEFNIPKKYTHEIIRSITELK